MKVFIPSSDFPEYYLHSFCHNQYVEKDMFRNRREWMFGENGVETDYTIEGN